MGRGRQRCQQYLEYGVYERFIMVKYDDSLAIGTPIRRFFNFEAAFQRANIFTYSLVLTFAAANTA